MKLDVLQKSSDFELDCALLTLGFRPVIMCIGSDRVTGDCLGPIVGQMLVERGADAFIYGTLSRPVTALNLKESWRNIKRIHPDKKVLAVDSSVGKECDIGKIRVAFGSIAPGSADGKKLPKVGDVSITATVTDLSKTPLSAVRLGVVYSLARDITERILHSISLYN
ncbi:MAG: spore protease YyaC [Clostridiales bacterium]|nr:spore protease YyaC [Clostridiales bacterium]